MKYKPTIYNTAEQHKQLVDYLSVANAMIQSLQEQLNEANELLMLYFPREKQFHSICVKPINDYRKKWGVK